MYPSIYIPCEYQHFLSKNRGPSDMPGGIGNFLEKASNNFD
jgi:hypothetical protein